MRLWMCIDICIDVCVGIYAGTCADLRQTSAYACLDMCINKYIDMCIDTCIDMSMDTCVDMCMDMCKDMCVEMCMDMCIDMCVEMCMDMGIDICLAQERARAFVRAHLGTRLCVLPGTSTTGAAATTGGCTETHTSCTAALGHGAVAVDWMEWRHGHAGV
jgi:hypothetical protein